MLRKLINKLFVDDIEEQRISLCEQYKKAYREKIRKEEVSSKIETAVKDDEKEEKVNKSSASSIPNKPIIPEKPSCVAMDCWLLAYGDPYAETYWMKKATAGWELASYAIDYLVNPKAILQNKLFPFEKEFVNTVAAYIAPEFGKIFKEVGVGNIQNHNSELINNKYQGYFIININELEAVVKNIPDFKSKVVAKFNLVNKVDTTPQDRVGVTNMAALQPFKIINREGISKRPADMPENMYNLYEMTFRSLLGDEIPYSYISNTGHFDIQINLPNGLTNQIILDDGSIMGGYRTSVLGRIIDQNNMIDMRFVDVVKHPDIAKAILLDPNYFIPDKNIVEADYFKNQGIYYNIDFNGMTNMNNMSPEELLQLESSLSMVMSILDPNDKKCRFRFEKYDNPFNYVLTSDNKVLSPLAQFDNTAPGLSPMKYIVECGKIKRYNSIDNTVIQYN